MRSNFFLLFWLLTVLVGPLLAHVMNSQVEVLDNHHDNEEVYEIIEFVNKKCPDITYVYDLPETSVAGNPLRVIVFSNNPSVHELGEPEFKYVANMHGNEVIGRELLLELMVQLCDRYLEDYQGTSPVTKLIHNTRIHLLVTMNPDGWDVAAKYEFSQVGSRFSSLHEMMYHVGARDPLVGRDNLNNVDLNRNFPNLDTYFFAYRQQNVNRTTPFDRELDIELARGHDCEGKSFQPETRAVMKWINQIPFVLSANLHEGSIVVNFPMDASPDNSPVYTASNDDDTFRYLAAYFVQQHEFMSKARGTVCHGEKFIDSITNGAEWYPICGGMQDYNHLASNCFEITIELGCQKFPPGKELALYWKDSMRSLFDYMWLSHAGVKGFVLDKFSRPVANAIVYAEKITYPTTFSLIRQTVQSTKSGEYWRILSPGSYRIWAAKNNQETPRQFVQVFNERYKTAKVVDLTFTL